jgi:hypothetical protein
MDRYCRYKRYQRKLVLSVTCCYNSCYLLSEHLGYYYHVARESSSKQHGNGGVNRISSARKSVYSCINLLLALLKKLKLVTTE